MYRNVGYLFVSVAVVMLAAALIHRSLTTGPPVPAVPLSTESSTIKAGTTQFQTVTAQKPVDIYFLSEAGTQFAKPRPVAHHIPVANGTRRIAAGRALTMKEDGHFLAPKWS